MDPIKPIRTKLKNTFTNIGVKFNMESIMTIELKGQSRYTFRKSEHESEDLEKLGGEEKWVSENVAKCPKCKKKMVLVYKKIVARQKAYGSQMYCLEYQCGECKWFLCICADNEEED